jgi:hypothetical protein
MYYFVPKNDYMCVALWYSAWNETQCMRFLLLDLCMVWRVEMILRNSNFSLFSCEEIHVFIKRKFNGTVYTTIVLKETDRRYCVNIVLLAVDKVVSICLIQNYCCVDCPIIYLFHMTHNRMHNIKDIFLTLKLYVVALKIAMPHKYISNKFLHE